MVKTKVKVMGDNSFILSANVGVNVYEVVEAIVEEATRTKTVTEEVADEGEVSTVEKEVPVWGWKFVSKSETDFVILSQGNHPDRKIYLRLIIRDNGFIRLEAWSRYGDSYFGKAGATPVGLGGADDNNTAVGQVTAFEVNPPWNVDKVNYFVFLSPRWFAINYQVHSARAGARGNTYNLTSNSMGVLGVFETSVDDITNTSVPSFAVINTGTATENNMVFVPRRFGRNYNNAPARLGTIFGNAPHFNANCVPNRVNPFSGKYAALELTVHSENNSNSFLGHVCGLKAMCRDVYANWDRLDVKVDSKYRVDPNGESKPFWCIPSYSQARNDVVDFLLPV